MIKKSMTIKGHRTSISLEGAFWTQLEGIAKDQKISVSALVAEIDDIRAQSLMRGDQTGGLSSMIRLFILEHTLSARQKETDLGR